MGMDVQNAIDKFAQTKLHTEGEEEVDKETEHQNKTIMTKFHACSLHN